jgi:AhpD family alkylhydroperoxidase
MTAESSLEARVPLLERDGVPAEVAVLYDKLYADRGVVPNMFKALANAPELVLGIAALLKPLMAEGALVGWYKELIATRVASLNQCEYCVSAHRFLAGKRGATPEQVASLEAFETGPFTEKEKAGFRYASLLHGSGHAIDEAAFAAAQRPLQPPGDRRTHRRSRRLRVLPPLQLRPADSGHAAAGGVLARAAGQLHEHFSLPGKVHFPSQGRCSPHPSRREAWKIAQGEALGMCFRRKMQPRRGGSKPGREPGSCDCPSARRHPHRKMHPMML